MPGRRFAIYGVSGDRFLDRIVEFDLNIDLSIRDRIGHRGVLIYDRLSVRVVQVINHR